MSAEDLAATLGENWAVSNGKAGLALFPEPPEATTTGFAYQGVLRDAQGLRLGQTEHTVEFRLYENATGGEALWGRSYPVLLDTNGLFNVALSDATGSAIGDGTPSNGLAKAIAGHVGTPLYLGLRVAGSGTEISPRQKLLAVPVATMALDATAASGDLSVAGKVESSTAKIAGAATAGTLTVTTNAVSVGGNLSLGGELKGPGSFPLGAIVLWHGSAASIPDGWKLCDGQNGTPDLRDRFVVGAGHDYAKGDQDGTKEVLLSENELPQHRHEYVGDDALAGIEPGCSTAIRTTSTRYDAESNHGANWYSQVYGTSYVGGNVAHENRPPFYALCYIMRVR
jgi:microcystin-dependent protein